MNRTKKISHALTTAQQLAGIIKSARDIMRKDKGLNGDADRLPMLTWIMFLKFLDDIETVRETEATLGGKRFHHAIEAPYRWRDWATKADGITGDELIAFINQDEATRPDGSRGAGLFAYLKNLQGVGSHDRRDTIAAVFRGTVNRMINGYLLRDVINKLEGVHFNSSEELHVLSRTYESMLKEMRDASGDAGEFYTPRPVVKLMVELTDPRLGEIILDPACGTGGFLVEAYAHLEKQCQTVKDRQILQKTSIQGCEAKPLPFLLATMNLLLHGLESPDIDPGNALRFPLKEIGDKERVDIILTNPPFGGEEERGILGNFPEDKQAAETTLLFMQLIMRKLKRKPKPGRAAVVVPNGTLYSAGVASRIRETLMMEFNLHTVVRLPKGVFEPYADIPTNILFFDRSGTTEQIWFYEHPLPLHRAQLKSPCYSQSDPLLFEEFQPLIDWWENREENENAWLEPIGAIRATEWNLDRKNPHPGKAESLLLDDLSAAALDYARLATTSLNSVAVAISNLSEVIPLEDDTRYENNIECENGTLHDYCQIIKGAFPTKKTPPGQYRFVVTAADARTADSFQSDAEAVCVPMVSSTGHGHAAIHRIHYARGKFALANIMAAIVVREGVDILPKFLYYYLWHYKDEKLVSLMAGTANTSLTIEKLKTVQISFPSLDRQRAIVEALDATMIAIESIPELVTGLVDLRSTITQQALRASLERMK